MRQLPKTYRAKSYGIGEESKVEQFARVVDGDETTAFDWNPTEIPNGPNRIHVGFILEDTSASANTVQMRVNSHTATDYGYILKSASGFNRDNWGSGGNGRQSEWVVGDIQAAFHMTGTISMTGGGMPTGTKIEATADIQTFHGNEYLDSAYLNKDTRVTDLRLWTTGTARGRAWVRGEWF